MLSWWDVSLIFHVHFLCWVIDTMMIIFVWVWKEVYVNSYQLWMLLIIVLFFHKNLPCQLSQECILLNLCDWYMVGFVLWSMLQLSYLIHGAGLILLIHDLLLIKNMNCMIIVGCWIIFDMNVEAWLIEPCLDVLYLRIIFCFCLNPVENAWKTWYFQNLPELMHGDF